MFLAGARIPNTMNKIVKHDKFREMFWKMYEIHEKNQVPAHPTY